jgi:hypothetical protein
LHELLGKKPVEKLTLNDVRRVRSLLGDLYKINRDLYEELDSQYINEESCCDELSAFEKQETRLIVTDLLGKKPFTRKNDEIITGLLSKMYYVTDDGFSTCGVGDNEAERIASLKEELRDMGYYKLTALYKKTTGMQFKPVKEWSELLERDGTIK